MTISGWDRRHYSPKGECGIPATVKKKLTVDRSEIMVMARLFRFIAA
jgi:hypothetical protein